MLEETFCPLHINMEDKERITCSENCELYLVTDEYEGCLIRRTLKVFIQRIQRDLKGEKK